MTYTVQFNFGCYSEFESFDDALEFAGENLPARIFGPGAEECEEYQCDGLSEDQRDRLERL